MRLTLSPDPLVPQGEGLKASVGYPVSLDVRVRKTPHVFRYTPALPGSATKINPSPWDQGEGQGRGFEL